MRFKAVLSISVVTLLAVFACATAPMTPDMTVRDLTPEYQAGKTKSKIDNFLVIMDTSLSMEDRDGEYVKFDLARSFVQRMNQTLPPLSVNGGLRTFGHDPAVARTFTALPYGMSPYRRADLAKALDSVSAPGGNSPMLDAVKAASADIEALTGKTALIIISDGKDIDNRPVGALEDLKKKMGDRLCVYTVLVGNDARGAALMQRLAGVGACGFATTAREVSSADQMADFVNKVFLAEQVVPPPPAPTPKPVVDVDSDGDGVPDRLDKCPGTPRGARVDADGCWVLADLNFDTNKADIKPAMMPTLNEALSVLRQNPSLRIEVQGHTDSDGAAAYNQQLSERRAQAVMNYFVQNGIAATRISAKGYGESSPIADNDTPSGKAQNRRVMLSPIQ
jgi:OmpA-OmpF porin, OOP family